MQPDHHWIALGSIPFWIAKDLVIQALLGHSFDKKHPGFSTRLAASFQDRLGLVAWNIAWREIAGLSNLYLSGKTKTFLPIVNATKA